MFASSVQAFFIFKPWNGNQVYLLHMKWVMQLCGIDICYTFCSSGNISPVDKKT